MNAVLRETKERDLRSKRHVFSTGRTQGGGYFSRGQIYHLLTNPIYLGLIRHKDQTFEGQHPAIIDKGLWDGVQQHLQTASARRRGASVSSVNNCNAPLKGKVRDETGDVLTPTHTNRHGKRQRYYVSNRLISDGPDPSGWRLPAKSFEQGVAKAIADHLENQANRHSVLHASDAATSEAASKGVVKLAEDIRTVGSKRAARLVRHIAIAKAALNIHLDPKAVADALNLYPQDLDDQLCDFKTYFQCKRRGVETRIVAGDAKPEPDRTLIRGLRNAHDWTEAMRSGEPQKDLAQRVGHSERYIRRITSLISLSPKLQAAILNGTQPQHLNLETLVRGDIPLDWTHQDRLFQLES